MRRFATLLSALSLGAILFVPGTSGAQQGPRPKLVVLGIDGASADVVERLMPEKKLPNLAALAARGGYAKLATSNPAQSPVSWAEMTTGLNPGGTGIFDFLRRVPSGQGYRATSIGIGLAEPVKRAPIAPWVRAALVFAAGAAGAAAGLGVVFALYAGPRRALRPRGMLQGAMTGAAALFSCCAYVVVGWLPAEVPFARNLRSGEPFWVTLDRAGVRCIALEAPLAFPADTMHQGCCLSGLGTPDLMGTWGTFAVWTDDPQVPKETETGGVVYFVQPDSKSFEVVLPGPANPFAQRDDVDAALRDADKRKYMRDVAFDWTLLRRRVDETEEEFLRMADRALARVKCTILRGGSAEIATPEGVTVTLEPGSWSTLVPVVYRLSPIVKVQGRVRFLLQSAGAAATGAGGPWQPMRLFVAPVQFDPGALPPNAQIASPMQFAADLAHDHGPFETIGWPELTNPVKDDVIADREFLAHLEVVRKGREKRLLDRLARDDWDCLFAMFAEPDRVQHALYRHVDPKSPRHDAAVAKEFAGEIDRSYLEVDRLVGDVVKAAGEGTQVLVVSDHGFAPFRRGVNLNNFLCSLTPRLQEREDQGGPQRVGNIGRGVFFEGVDWTKTKAYAIGLGNVYLNLEGREAHGSVTREEAPRVLAEIERALYALRDADGSKVVRKVYRGKDLYSGERAHEAPDLVVGFEWGYRVSWQTSLGALDDDVITDNPFRWSGDHCSVDPDLVPGILFSSIPLAAGAAPRVTDVAPTILSYFGVTNPKAEGRTFTR